MNHPHYSSFQSTMQHIHSSILVFLPPLNYPYCFVFWGKLCFNNNEKKIGPIEVELIFAMLLQGWGS